MYRSDRARRGLPVFAMFTAAVTARKVAPNWTHSRATSPALLQVYVYACARTHTYAHKVSHEPRAPSFLIPCIRVSALPARSPSRRAAVLNVGGRFFTSRHSPTKARRFRATKGKRRRRRRANGQQPGESFTVLRAIAIYTFQYRRESGYRSFRARAIDGNA